jgi:hypothetical protein
MPLRLVTAATGDANTAALPNAAAMEADHRVGRLHRLLMHRDGHAIVDLPAYLREIADAAMCSLAGAERTEFSFDLNPHYITSPKQGVAIGLLVAPGALATTAYTDTLTGTEIVPITSTLGTFVGVATGQLPAAWRVQITHEPLATGPSVLITGGTLSLRTRSGKRLRGSVTYGFQRAIQMCFVNGFCAVCASLATLKARTSSLNTDLETAETD